MALGAFPASDRRWLGMLGMHGTCAANWAMDEADLIVAVGARFDDRVTGALDEFAPHAKVVHIDVDPAEIGKNVAAHVPIVGDARRALAAIADAYAGEPGRLAEWWARIDGWRADDEPRNDAEVALDALQEAIGGDAIVTTDVGQHQMWAANRLRFDRPRRWITSGGLGTMGFGLPAAIGAQIACPDETVVCVTGEGSLLLNVQELATVAHERLPIKVVVLDNALARHGPPAAGHVLGRAPQRGRSRRHAGLAGTRAFVRVGRARRRPGRRTRRARARRSCGSRSIRRTIACRCSSPGGAARAMIGT